MSLIRISNLTFGYEGSPDPVFQNVSLQIDTNWRLGLIGRNGRGKTTLLRILAGRLPYSGSVTASVGFDLFPFAVPNPARHTLPLLRDCAPDAEPWRIERELSLLGVRGDVLARPFATLSGGERTKALLAALFSRENRFLLIDEPTNHLDAQAREAVGRYLASKSGFILVSHDRALLDRCIDHVLSINRAGIELQRGNFSSWQRNRERQDAYERAEQGRLQKDMKKLEAAARQTAAWSDRVEKEKTGTRNSGLRPDTGYLGHRAAKMMKRSKSLESRRKKAIEEKSALLKNEEETGALIIRTIPYRKEVLARAEDLSLFYDGAVVAEHISFTLRRGDRLALTGRNGSGKTSLFRLLLGGGVSHRGALTVGSDLVISYVSQDTGLLQGDLTAYAREQKIDIPVFLAILRKLGFPRDQFSHHLAALSEGQKKKVLIAQSLSKPAHLYLWDEPFNFIDVIARMQIEELLLAGAPTMLFVEHDRAFCERIATGEVALTGQP